MDYFCEGIVASSACFMTYTTSSQYLATGAELCETWYVPCHAGVKNLDGPAGRQVPHRLHDTCGMEIGANYRKLTCLLHPKTHLENLASQVVHLSV